MATDCAPFRSKPDHAGLPGAGSREATRLRQQLGAQPRRMGSLLQARHRRRKRVCCWRECPSWRWRAAMMECCGRATLPASSRMTWTLPLCASLRLSTILAASWSLSSLIIQVAHSAQLCISLWASRETQEQTLPLGTSTATIHGTRPVLKHSVTPLVQICAASSKQRPGATEAVQGVQDRFVASLRSDKAT